MIHSIKMYLLEFFDSYANISVEISILIHLFLMHTTPEIMVNLKTLKETAVIAIRDGLTATLVLAFIFSSKFSLILLCSAFLNAVVYPGQYTR